MEDNPFLRDAVGHLVAQTILCMFVKHGTLFPCDHDCTQIRVT